MDKNHNTPDFSSIKAFYNEKPVLLPKDLEIVVSDEWKNVGTHKVRVELKHPFLKKIIRISHSMQLYTHAHQQKPNQATSISITYSMMKLNSMFLEDLVNSNTITCHYIIGYGYNKDENNHVEQEDGRILSLHTFSMNYKKIIIIDQLIPDYNTSVVIEIKPKKSDDL